MKAIRKDFGFTLIEILVVLAVIVITLAGGVVVLPAGRKIWERKVSPPTPVSTPTPPETAPIPSPTSTNLKIEQDIYTELRQKGKALVIVTLKGSTKSVTPETEAERFRENAQILAEVLRELSLNQDEFELLREWSSTAQFAGIVHSESVLEKLNNHPKVKSVQLDRPVPYTGAEGEKSLLREQCKTGVRIFKSGENPNNYVLLNKEGAFIIGKEGNVISQPEKVPGHEGMELCGKYRCESAGGTYKTFPTTCADSCEFARKGYDVFCGEALTDSCDCGPDKCWNGVSCEPN